MRNTARYGAKKSVREGREKNQLYGTVTAFSVRKHTKDKLTHIKYLCSHAHKFTMDLDTWIESIEWHLVVGFWFTRSALFRLGQWIRLLNIQKTHTPNITYSYGWAWKKKRLNWGNTKQILCFRFELHCVSQIIFETAEKMPIQSRICSMKNYWLHFHNVPTIFSGIAIARCILMTFSTI